MKKYILFSMLLLFILLACEPKYEFVDHPNTPGGEHPSEFDIYVDGIKDQRVCNEVEMRLLELNRLRGWNENHEKWLGPKDCLELTPTPIIVIPTVSPVLGCEIRDTKYGRGMVWFDLDLPCPYLQGLSCPGDESCPNISTDTQEVRATPTFTVVPSTETPVPLPTIIPLPTVTFTPTPTETPVQEIPTPPPPIPTPMMTVTSLPVTATVVVTSVPPLLPTETPKPPTASPVPIVTVIPTPTNTPTRVATLVPNPTSTFIPTSTPRPTFTRIPTVTKTPIIIPTARPTHTPIPIPTSTNTPIPTSTIVRKPTELPTMVPTNTPLPTQTAIPTATMVPTPNPMIGTACGLVKHSDEIHGAHTHSMTWELNHRGRIVCMANPNHDATPVPPPPVVTPEMINAKIGDICGSSQHIIHRTHPNGEFGSHNHPLKILGFASDGIQICGEPSNEHPHRS